MKTDYTNNRQRDADSFDSPSNWYLHYKSEKELKEHAQKLCIERLDQITSLQKQIDQLNKPTPSSTEKWDKLNEEFDSALESMTIEKWELLVQKWNAKQQSTLFTPSPSTVEDSFSFNCTESDCPHCSHDENEFKSDTIDFEREAIPKIISIIAATIKEYHPELFNTIYASSIFPERLSAKILSYIKGRQTTSQEGLMELVEWKSLKEELPVDAFLCWVKRIDGSIYIGFRSNKPLSENPDPSKDCYWTGDKYGSFDLRFMDGVHFHCHFSDLTVIEWAYILPPKANEILNSKTINMKKVKTIKVPPTMSAHEANKLYGDRYGVDWEYE